MRIAAASDRGLANSHQIWLLRLIQSMTGVCNRGRLTDSREMPVLSAFRMPAACRSFSAKCSWFNSQGSWLRSFLKMLVLSLDGNGRYSVLQSCERGQTDTTTWLNQQDISAEVMMGWGCIPAGSLTIHGLRCRPFKIHWRQVIDTASAVIVDSTIPNPFARRLLLSSFAAAGLNNGSRLKVEI